MDEKEKLAVERRFAELVKEGQADYLSDDLYTAGALTLDDYQRVRAQITDSDKMRVLLILLLRKVKTAHVNVFQAMLQALQNNQRPDLVKSLQQCHKDQSFCQRMTAAALQSVASGNSCGGFTFLAGTVPSCGSKEKELRTHEGMDVTDSAIPQHKANKETTLPDQSVVDSVELSPSSRKTSTKPTEADPLVVSPKDLSQMKELARKTSGKFYVQDREFQYELSGQFDGSRLSWCARITDQSSGRSEEKTSDDGNRGKLLEECLLAFTKPASS